MRQIHHDNLFLLRELGEIIIAQIEFIQEERSSVPLEICEWRELVEALFAIVEQPEHPIRQYKSEDTNA